MGRLVHCMACKVRARSLHQELQLAKYGHTTACDVHRQAKTGLIVA